MTVKSRRPTHTCTQAWRHRHLRVTWTRQNKPSNSEDKHTDQARRHLQGTVRRYRRHLHVTATAARHICDNLSSVHKPPQDECMRPREVMEIMYMVRRWWLCLLCSEAVCYTEKAPNAWQRRGTQKTRNTYNQPNRPNRQTSQTKHQALPKAQPGRHITPINTAAVHASAQRQPTISTHTRQGHHQILRSPESIQAGWLSKRAG